MPDAAFVLTKRGGSGGGGGGDDAAWKLRARVGGGEGGADGAPRYADLRAAFERWHARSTAEQQAKARIRADQRHAEQANRARRQTGCEVWAGTVEMMWHIRISPLNH